MGRYMVCEYCGKEYFVKRPNTIKRNKHHFCSRECYYKWVKAGNGSRKQDWSFQRMFREIEKKIRAARQVTPPSEPNFWHGK